jgi:hypothetical protein
VELEQRVWLRRKWVRQSARIDETGILKVSSTYVHEKLEYNLCGAIAVFLTGDLAHKGDGQPILQIKLNPKFQFVNTPILSFRLLSTDDIGLWAAALSRYVFVTKKIGPIKPTRFRSRYCKVRRRIRDDSSESGTSSIDQSYRGTDTPLKSRTGHVQRHSQSSCFPAL